MNTYNLPNDTLQIELASFKTMKRVLIAGRLGLLEEGVARLLTTRQDLEVFHSDDSSAEALMLKVAQIHPDVMILCQAEAVLPESLISMLAGIPTLADLRVIIVHLQNTDMNIYQHRNWFSVELAAFFPMVYGENIDDLQIEFSPRTATF